MLKKLYRTLLGKPRDLDDPRIFHHIALIPLLAWVGLGADGLSSSTYGPEETFRMLGSHPHLAVVLAVAMIFTIAIISYAYSRIIEHFPFGGGGYVIATTLLGPKAGLVSGASLLVDYVLTISVSIAAGTDAFFSFVPIEYHYFKIHAAIAAIIMLTLLNLRGIKESILILMPIFVTFLITHAAMIAGSIFGNFSALPDVAREVHTGFSRDISTIGWAGMIALCLRAYSFGCGTYTGIEAVSNGLSIMRDPKVETGKRTMLYMASSLAITASGLILAYLLFRVVPVDGKTMNATLAERFVASFSGGPSVWGQSFIIITLLAESALLIVAAQAGFIDGPRVMANMASDSWLPHRLSRLSDRLTTQDGILFMSGASIATLMYAHGHTATLVVMYSINVFITFTLSEISMVRFWLMNRFKYTDWHRKISVHITGLVLCATILVINLYEKFYEGGWVTMAITLSLIALCFFIRDHYQKVRSNLARLDEILAAIPKEPAPGTLTLDPNAPTAVLMVGGHMGLGIHSLYSIQRLFPNYFKNFIFVSVGVVDSAAFKEEGIVTEVRSRTEKILKKYLTAAQNLGLAAESRAGISTDVIEESEQICREVVQKYPRAFIFCGKLIFENETLWNRFLHNDTAYALQRHLQFSGLNCTVLPVRIISN